MNIANSIKNLILILVLTAGIFSIVRLPLLAYGQTSPPTSSSPSHNTGGSDSMKKKTSGGAIDVILQPSPEPVGHSGQTSLKVQFMTKGTEYNLILTMTLQSKITLENNRVVPTNENITTEEQEYKEYKHREPHSHNKQ